MEDATVIPDSSSSPPPPDHPVDSVADEFTTLSLLSADTVTDTEKVCIDEDVGGATDDAMEAAEVEEREEEQVEEAAAVVEEEEEEREKEEEEGGDMVDSINSNNSSDKRGKYPVRPEAQVCSFYMKTGMCKFGLNCKFNHPFRKSSSQGGKVRGKEGSLVAASENVKGNDDYMEKEGQVECKYFDRPGGCKYGQACKFNHSKKTTPASELNFMGLPIRAGERECPYYMRNGSCKFGASCRFNHPDPTSTSVGGPNALPNYSNGGSVSTPSASQSTLKSWSPPASNDKSAYAPLMFPPTQGAPSRPEWSAYQTRGYQPGLLSMPQPYAMNRQPTERAIYSHQQDHMLVDEFPERPGQPECSYFLKTGTCKYKSACKFHHPKKVSEKSSVCSLSEIGLPLRPGEDICSYYGRYGICKYGPACKYDHPVNHAPSGVMTPGFGNSMVINHAMAAGS